MPRKRFQTKRTVKRVSAMVLMVSLLLLCACAEPLELYVPDDAAVYTSEDAAVLLKDAMQWNMTHLVQHELYIKDDTLYMDCRIYQGSELVYEDVHDLVYDRA